MNGASDLDHQPANAHDAAEYIDAVDVVDLFGQSFHCEEPVIEKSPSLRKP